MPRDLAASLPRTARLTFPGRACGKATSAPASWSADVALADAAPADAGRGVDATWGLSDTCTAVYSDANPTVDPSNKDSLVALAKRLAHDLWQWRTAGFDGVYAGISAPDLSGLDDAVEWSYRADDCSTRLSTSTDGEPDRFNHADPARDCPDCVGVYGPALSKAGNQVVMRKYKLCLEGDEVRAYADGQDGFDGCCTGACTTYRIVVYRPGGTIPVPGVAVAFNRYIGSWTTPSGGTFSPVVGTTDSTGAVVYTLPDSPPSFIASATATTPDGGPSSTAGFAKSGTTCTATFGLCRYDVLHHYLDGDGGSLGDRTGASWVLTGGQPSPTGHLVTYSDPMPSIADYWSGCPIGDNNGQCYGAAIESHQYFWKRSKYVGQPASGSCHDGRSSVLLKSICLELQRYYSESGGPAIVDRSTSVTLAWDSTSWDGDRSTSESLLTGNTRDANGDIRMLYTGGGYSLGLFKTRQRNGATGDQSATPLMSIVAMPPQDPFLPDYRSSGWNLNLNGGQTHYADNGSGPILRNGRFYGWTAYASDGPCGTGPYELPTTDDGGPAVAMMVILHPGPATESLA